MFIHVLNYIFQGLRYYMIEFEGVSELLKFPYVMEMGISCNIVNEATVGSTRSLRSIELDTQVVR